MNGNHFLWILISSLFFSCGQEEKQDVIPANVLPLQKMSQVLADVHIAQAEGILKFPADTSSRKIDFEKIFKQDTISKQQYEESLHFYIDHPRLLDSVYVEVLNELSKIQGNAQ